jgi:hypothetical protein
MIEYLLVATFFAADGSVSQIRAPDAVTYQECLQQIADVSDAGESILTCEPVEAEPEPTRDRTGEP